MAAYTIEPPAGESPLETEPRARSIAWTRTLRLVSGLIIFSFLLMHLLNHAAGIFGIGVLDILQTWRWMIWMNPVGTALLYGAFAVHIALGVQRILSRKTWRMHIDEAAQLASGILIPIFLLPHVVHTRVAGTWFVNDQFYATVLAQIWPGGFLWQSTLVLLAWAHGCLGVHMAFRHRTWFRTLRWVPLVLAIVIPTLAIAGFIASGREASLAPPEPGASAEQIVALKQITMRGYLAIGAIALLVVGILKFGYFRRRLGTKITINYRGRGPVRVACGTTVLEASRIHDIPHPSICRGRGRCSTCRVQILSDPDALPPPSELEKAALDRVGALKNVRLACQLRPTEDVSLRILLPVLGRSQDPETQVEIERWAVERVATIVVIDLRAFNVLVHSQVPYELVALLNRFSSEMRQAVENHGGTISTFYGDGFIALFDTPENERAGARQSFNAARDMSHVIQVLNKEMGGALPIPIRVGIGIHSGKVTLARIGSSERLSEVMAFGFSVNIASALQSATNHALVDCLVSEETAKLARLDVSGLKMHEVDVEGGEGPIRAYAIADWRILKNRLLDFSPEAAEAEGG